MSGARLFVSYSHAPADVSLRRGFDPILGILRDLRVVEHWQDTQIPAGSEWRDEIWSALNRAAIVVLLISPDYLASAFCREELRHAKGRAAQGLCRVVPVLLRETPCWEDYVGALQALPRNGKPVKAWGDSDRRGRTSPTKSGGWRN